MKESDGFEECGETSPSADVSTTRLNDDSDGCSTTLGDDEAGPMIDSHLVFDLTVPTFEWFVIAVLSNQFDHAMAFVDRWNARYRRPFEAVPGGPILVGTRLESGMR